MFSKKSISLLLVVMVGFIDFVGIGLVYPMFASMLFQPDSTLLPDGTTDTFKGAMLGILLAAGPLTQFFFSPILGMMSDQKGRKRILIPTLGIGVLGYLIAMLGANIESLFLLILSRILIGISAGTASIVSAALADISTPEEKAKNFGLLNMAFGLGFTVGPFFGGVLSQMSFGPIVGYAMPFAVAGGVTLLNLISSLLFFEETYVPKAIGKLSFNLGIRNIRKAFQKETLRMIFLAVFLGCMGWSFYWEFAPVTWIGTYGYDAAAIGNLYAYGAAVYALSCGVLIRPIVSRFSNKAVLCVAMILCGLSIGLLVMHSNSLWLWLYIPIQQFAIALFWPTASAVVSNMVDEDVQGETLGVLHSMDSLAFSVSPLIAGPLLGITILMPFVVGGGALFVSGMMLSIYLKRSAKRSAAVSVS